MPEIPTDGGSVFVNMGPMSQIISAVVIQFLTIGLPLIGVTLGSDQLTSFAQTLIMIGTGVWIWVRRVQMRDVTAAGVRK